MKRLSCVIGCTFGNFEQLAIMRSFIPVIVDAGISLRGRSVDKRILLDGNFGEASVVRVEMSEINSSVELILSRSLVPVWRRII